MTNVTFKEAFMYSFNRPKGLLNIFWVFLPILGWFALLGYLVRIVQGFVKGNFKELPVMKFAKHLELGFIMFLKALPFAIAYMVAIIILTLISEPLGSLVDFLAQVLVIPILSINFLVNETVASFFDFKKINAVFAHFIDYIIVVVKSILLGIVFLIMWVVLVGIPAGLFTQNIFLADFYRQKVLKETKEKAPVKKAAKKTAKKSSKKSTKKARKKTAKKK